MSLILTYILTKKISNVTNVPLVVIVIGINTGFYSDFPIVELSLVTCHSMKIEMTSAERRGHSFRVRVTLTNFNGVLVGTKLALSFISLAVVNVHFVTGIIPKKHSQFAYFFQE